MGLDRRALELCPLDIINYHAASQILILFLGPFEVLTT